MTSLLAASFRVLRPEALLLLIVLYGVVAWIALLGRGTRKGVRTGEAAALVARGVMLLIVVLALSLPRLEFESRFRSVAYVLDVSDSVPKAALDDAKEFVRRSASLRKDDDDAAFVVFAQGAAVEAPMARISATKRDEPIPIDPKNISTRIPTAETDVEGALRLARAGFPTGGARSIVLVTDGNETQGDALAAVRELVADHTGVTVVPIRYARDREVWIAKVVAPSQSAENAPVPVRVIVESTHGPVTARLRCLVDGVEAQTQQVKLDRGRNVFALGVPFATAGFHRIEAIVEPEIDGDPVNNRGAAATFVRGKGRVLLASNAEGSPLAAALADGLGIDVDSVVGGSLPADPGGYVPYDCVVIENVPAWMLTDVQRRVLKSAVEDMGTGLVCIGGPQTYGPGGYGGTDLEAVLPVTSDVKNRRVMPGGALVVALHSCEFPDGNSIGREVTKLAIQALSSDDEMGLVEYSMDGKERWVIPLTRVGTKESHMAQVAKAEPSDAPSLHAILQRAADALALSGASAKHVILVSDGDPQPPSDKLLAYLHDELRATVTTICVDSHTPDGPRSMKHIADATGGTAYELKSSARDRLPQIFIKEAVTVRRSAWSEEPFTPTVRGIHRMLNEVADGGLPLLLGHTVVSIRPEAELVLSGPEDDPVLATWRRGLGQATAWTSDASPRWAQNWVGWAGYGRFWTQVVRGNLRSVEHLGAKASAEIDGGVAHVVLDALREDGSFDNGLRVAGTATAPDGRATEFKLTATGPGRYEGEFPATDVGTWLATLHWADPRDATGKTISMTQAAVCVAYSAEHLAQHSNERLFALLEGAGARILDVEALDRAAAADAKQPDAASIPWTGPVESTEEPVELWPWLAGLAALVLVLDVAVRRVRIDWSKFRRKPSAAAAGAIAARPAAGAARPRPAGSFDPATAPPVDTSSAAPSTGAAPASAPTTPQPPASESPGLLDAKRRAQKKQKWEEN
ncbi:MAG: VWA domain-containing protein [Planctomycetes bacterium]|nr:VWA domain-containing protein [Planctomycetota bacterium]